MLYRVLSLDLIRKCLTKKFHDSQSFNDVFAAYCTGEDEDETKEFKTKLPESVDALNVDKSKFGTASALVAKGHPLDPQNLTGSYFEQLESAVEEFCCTDTTLLETINDVFEQTYHDVFGKDPAGDLPGALPRRR